MGFKGLGFGLSRQPPIAQAPLHSRATKAIVIATMLQKSKKQLPNTLLHESYKVEATPAPTSLSSRRGGASD